MKVLHVISDRNIGGAGILLCSLLRHFDKREIESVVALPKGSLLAERLLALDIPVIELEHPCERLCAHSVREIGALIRKRGIQLVHTNAAVSARVAGKRAGICVLFTRHCCFPPTGVWRFCSARAAGGFCNRMLTDGAIATAEAAAENLRAYGLPPEKIHVIINGSDPVRTVRGDELAAVRAQLGISAGEFVVGICARLEACKGQDVFLRAAARVSEAHPEKRFRFLIVGTGSTESELRALAERLGITRIVSFTGFVRDMAPVYRLLRINVNCSRGTETSCLALSEGMSAGVPMLVSDYGGNPAMLGGSLAGFLFPTDDAEALAARIACIACNPTLESQMRAAALARYESHYTADRMAREVSALYRRLLAEKT